MRENQQGFPLCDECDAVATVNYQESIVRYTIADGMYDFDESDLVMGGENVHLCDEHDVR